jgi:hypothetical protein
MAPLVVMLIIWIMLVIGGRPRNVSVNVEEVWLYVDVRLQSFTIRQVIEGWNSWPVWQLVYDCTKIGERRY